MVDCLDCQSLLVDNNQTANQSTRLYLYTKYNIYYIHDYVVKDMADNQLKVRDIVYKPFMLGGILFTACGQDGIDIHVQNDQAQFEYSKTLRIEELDIINTTTTTTNTTNQTGIDIRDIHISRDGRLHILCYNTGLHIY